MRLWWSVAAMLAAVPAGAQSGPAIDLNQIGFEPGDPKLAILRDAGTAPLAWELVDGAGKSVASGKTAPYGPDAASGATVQRIDFSAVRTPGTGYRLRAAGVTSDPFPIGPGLYRPLAIASVNFFYQQRAGIAIEARYAGGAAWARPAGHKPERATCFSGADEQGNVWPGCGYTIDVTGGWYDAGDHGKYVVNGGISLWTLLDAYERRPKAFPDGSLPVPEAGNGVSDLLDEARWEMEFLLRMQIADGVHTRVPVGKLGGKGLPPFVDIDAGGMAHQKVADRQWTALPTPPYADTQPRLLYPPTTAATLNLAATAAQCARVWRGIDDAFAARCLAAARRAWDAARRNPEVYATSSFAGSGGYGDGSLGDEFYWAAAELYTTTGDATYRRFVVTAPEYLGAPTLPGWGATGTLGTITLATVPNRLPRSEVKRMQNALVELAERFLGEIRTTGYAIPYASQYYGWGSNSGLANEALVLGVAGDVTGSARYRAGVIAVMDYLLGRNPLGRSFVSGFGARPMRNPHHRFWAHSIDPKLPGPPPGVLSLGPNNTAMIDAVASKMKGKCAPQRCWVDDLGAFTMNEVAINGNAPLFWAAAWLDD